MASDWSEVCDAIVDDLLNNVSALRGALPHKYSPYDPEELTSSAGERHLSVYPVASTAQTAEPHITGPRGDLLTEVYRVVYWEDAGDESARGSPTSRPPTTCSSSRRP